MDEHLAELTERQCYWLEHIRACDSAGRSTVEYAKARQVLIEKGVWSIDKMARKPSPLQRVQVRTTATAGQWQIQLLHSAVD